MVYLFVLYFGLIGVLDAVSSKLTRKQAEDITILVKHEIIDALATSKYFNLDLVSPIFERVKHVTDEGSSFEISKILLIDTNFMVIAAYPESEIGSDYSTHYDIRESLEKKRHLVADEAPSVQMGVLRRGWMGYLILKCSRVKALPWRLILILLRAPPCLKNNIRKSGRVR